jgi:hypothetical protein
LHNCYIVVAYNLFSMQKRATEQFSRVVELEPDLLVSCALSDLMCVCWLGLGRVREHERVHELVCAVSDNSVWCVSCDGCLLVFSGAELIA